MSKYTNNTLESYVRDPKTDKYVNAHYYHIVM